MGIVHSLIHLVLVKRNYMYFHETSHILTKNTINNVIIRILVCVTHESFTTDYERKTEVRRVMDFVKSVYF